MTARGFEAVTAILAATAGVSLEPCCADEVWVHVDRPDDRPLGMARTEEEMKAGLAPQVPPYLLRVSPCPDGVALVRYDCAGDPVEREWVAYPLPPDDPWFQAGLADVLVPVLAGLVEARRRDVARMDRVARWALGGPADPARIDGGLGDEDVWFLGDDN